MDICVPWRDYIVPSFILDYAVLERGDQEGVYDPKGEFYMNGRICMDCILTCMDRLRQFRTLR